MILPDVNLLIHAHNPSSADHRRAKLWWEGLLNSSTPVFLPWAVTLGFVRLVTNPRVFLEPVTPDRACRTVEAWFERENVAPLDPGSRHRSVVFGLLRKLGTAGNLTTDAHLAALALEHDLELHSTDADFSRFVGLRWLNPLVEPSKKGRSTPTDRKR